MSAPAAPERRINWRRLWRHTVVHFTQDRVPELSAALSYRTIFSLIPVLVLVLVILKAFYGDKGVRDGLDQVFKFTGLSELALPGKAGEGTAQAVGTWIEQFVNAAVQRIGQVNTGAVAVVGLVLFVYAALILLVQIEQAFNTVCRAPAGRSMAVRLTTYWTLLTLGGLAIAASLGLGQWYRATVARLGTAAGWAVEPVQLLTSIGLAWLLLVFAYRRMPTARLGLGAVAVGAAVAAVAWEIGKRSLAYAVTFLTHKDIAIYGSLALLPLVLFWIYITWLIVLYGLDVAVTIDQYRSGELEDPDKESAIVDPSVGVLLLKEAADAFAGGRPIAGAELARRAALSPAVADRLLRHLVGKCYLHRIPQEGEDDLFALARPAESLRLDEVIRSVQGLGAEADSLIAADSAIARLRERQHAAVAGMTLADMLAPAPPSARNQSESPPAPAVSGGVKRVPA
ncbi:MAG: YihY family inner membrane protein [Phycisphaerales bacterium]|nr:YihY family inner membrane protein [Phycisphaerales bacterium]